jgi:thiamine pyrophosphate-dependent acetolactate synthase large subunit-like protein
MLTIDEYFDTIAERCRETLVICGLGVSTDEWWARTERRDTFFVNGAMGYAGSIGLGLALSVPDHKVLVLDSDGGMAMNPSGLITEASRQPDNMIHLVLNNRCYGVLNRTPIVNGEITDYAGMARAAGIAGAMRVDSRDDLDRVLTTAMSRSGHTFAEVSVEPPSTPDADFEPPLPMPYEGPEMKYVFGRTVEARTGRTVFGPQGF